MFALERRTLRSLDETSTMSTEQQVQQEKQARQDNFSRVRTYSDSIPVEQMTRSMIRQMLVPTSEQLLLLKQQMKLFGVLVNNTKVNSGGEILYAFTNTINEEEGIYISNHIFDVDNDNMRSLL